MNKKAISPVISTVLLIAIVIILAIIIFLWASSFVKEKIEKFDKPIENLCKEVKFQASLDVNELTLVNKGNVPIYKIDVKEQMAGKSKIQNYAPDIGKGGSTTLSISIDSDTESIIVIPVLLGKSGNQIKEFTCPENYGVEVEL